MFGNKLSKIEKLAAKKKTDALIPYVSDKNEEARLAAVRALGQCTDDAAYNALVPLVHDQKSAIRKAAVLALAEMNRPSARVHIEHQMRSEKDAEVLSAIQTALSRLKEKM